MGVRRLSLEEWFLDLQLRTVDADHVHLPFTVDLPAEPLVAPWQAVGRRAPMPAMMVRALGVLGAQRPEVNRMLFRTPLGPRMLEPDGVHVNVPVLLEHEGRRLLSAHVVRDADTKTVEAIGEELRQARRTDPRTLRINRMFLDGRNTWWRRVRLRVLHHLAYRNPWAYAAGGGGALAMSSLYHHGREGVVARGASFGPNVLTILLLGRQTGPDGAEVLRLGVGFDHAALGGDAFMAALTHFTDLLRDPGGTGLGPSGTEDGGDVDG